MRYLLITEYDDSTYVTNSDPTAIENMSDLGVIGIIDMHRECEMINGSWVKIESWDDMMRNSDMK